MSLVAKIASLTQRDALTRLGIALSVAWLLLIALFWVLAPGGDGAAGGVGRLVAAAGAILPLALIWMAVTLARSIAILRAEAEDLRERLTQLREMAATRGAPPQSRRPAATGDIASGTSVVAAPAGLPAPVSATGPATRAAGAVTTAAPPPRPADTRQAALRFDAPESVSVPPRTLIRALDFPNGPEDTEAIAALRTALKDHDNSRLLRAAQDVVTLLAGQDLYMDDLQPSPPDPAVWRRFAEGARGGNAASLGGIHDQSALQIVSGILRGDEIFRDAAHHFLRQFDTAISRLVPQLDDAEIEVLAQTRSARAFMLLGRVAGIFD
ncbi:MAG: hypothetical protein CMI50_08705 [Paracoccus sp.]|uniref:hypothetical protein n=1 Tax=unclassified Paracoccus (in: a-proteobacteria) TaxID=2688777 RepID=UPI000C64185C|nr:hypothetical protein [Paracoccus sp. UBA5162]MAN56531.1 hypothetical protein [Paracoccus sp. (in: a-proteobacteria)]|tara:strand:+ start:638 stop:1612 length:975 start_codon:yes stop_codon:yes gene_type:complete